MKCIVILAALAVMAGCSPKFGCNQYPETGCMPVSTVYDRTNNGFVDYRHQQDAGKAGSKGHRYNHFVDDRIRVGAAHKQLNYANPGDPILTQPVILRVLVAPWEDKQNDLNAGGFLYLKLRESEWVMAP